MRKEILAGIGVAVIIFLALSGYQIMPYLLLGAVGLAMFFLLQQRGLLPLGIGEDYVPATKITFDDIGGQSSAKKELQEALEFIIRGHRIHEMGIRPLKGILLTGPPGTGKTLLAKAAATFTDSTFMATSGSEFIEMYAGVGAQRVRNLFRKAREKAKKESKGRSIVFIDEIEVLGGKRGSHSGHLEYDQTLNQLLVEMDGLNDNEEVRILVIGATNRKDMLDPAILRPGRFDRIVHVDLPEQEARLQILKLHCRNKPLADDADLESISRETFGFSGAHLESIANEAAILALREEAKYVTNKHMREAVDKVILGEKLERCPSQEERYRISVHETGHALVSEVVRPDSVSHLTITSRGNALGYMRQNPAGDLYLYTRNHLNNQIRICLAGAVAEEIMTGERSTGATNDFEEAIRHAQLIIKSGLSHLGIVAEADIPKNILHQTTTTILAQQEEVVRSILICRRDVLTEVSHNLMDRECLSGEQLRQLIRKNCA
ncbi:MAG: AAA family ATPase [Bacillota bacterium]